MADNSKITQEQVAELTATLRGEAALDAKVKLVTVIKSGIKQHHVPEASVPQLAETLRMASTSPHASLANAGFTALGYLLTRLSRQEPRMLAKETPRCLPVVVDKLGDQKDKFRALAVTALCTMHGVAAADVERAVKTSALAGKNPRAKETAMQWLVQMHHEQGMQFRAYVPLLMELLEDADGAVRDAAKGAVIDLFKNAPSAAKSDLKRQLKSHKVRPAIEQAIVKSLGPSTRPETPAESVSEHRRVALGASLSSLASERPVTPMADSQTDVVEALYIDTHRELDDMFRDMAWAFDGKETEQNWMKREQSMTALRRLLAGNAPSDLHDALVASLRGMLDGIIKAATSLRTSLSKEACSLVQDMALALGPGLDAMVELLMQTFVKLSAGTKKISSQQANVTVDKILGRVSYTPRLMQHVWAACQDKNVQPRTYATGWIKTILTKQAHHKSQLEHTGGVDLMEKCIKKGLGDANPAVREKMRSTYWAFWGVWPARADSLMADLDATAQKLLSRDTSNPNASSKPADTAARPGLGLSKSTMSVSKPNLRETMMAQRKALVAAKKLPARPGSAMAHISPPRVVSSSSSSGTWHAASKSRSRADQTVSVNAGGMSVAPMRPARRRPEMVARPATAGPYSIREEHPPSPEAAKRRAATPRAREPWLPRSKELSSSPRARTASSPRARAASSPRHDDDSWPRPGREASLPRCAREASLPRSTRDGSSPASFKDQSPRRTLPRAHSAYTSSLGQHDASSPASKIPSPRGATLAPRFALSASLPVSSPVPSLEDMTLLPPPPQSLAPVPVLDEAPATPSHTLKVYQDPAAHVSPPPLMADAVLEDKPVNQDAAKLQRALPASPQSPEKTHQTWRLFESGITRIKARALDVHGFRKLQSLLRDPRTPLPDDTFDALVANIVDYIQDPQTQLGADRAQDLTTQALHTLNLLVARDSPALQAHIPPALAALVRTRSRYDSRVHLVSGLELLASRLVHALSSSPTPAMDFLAPRLDAYCADTSAPTTCRSLSMGLHVLADLVGVPASDDETIWRVAGLATRALDASDSGVRMDAVKLCVALHERAGDQVFWQAMQAVGDDTKSLITYYIVKHQRQEAAA
ncbi:hypothetical protein CDD82_6553 [Ophiocordyceps australis]|uniref:TOG domain-containing protein n=1 Tax=Ophiocordyceps australis TaxID=1399860 RepID=A0A2C5YWS0_9HYPO|nr:hypothetical protein CDD82_6553 [Ophiocordyceps australis]